MNITVGIIGLGYWGPNYIRNFIKHSEVNVVWGCDMDDKAIDYTTKNYPHIKVTKDYKDLLKDSSLQCIAIATPPGSHYTIAKESLKANKHVIIAKPLTTNSKQAAELLNIAKNKKLLLYGDLTYLHTGSVNYIKNFIEKGNLGDCLYYDSVRSNLGLIQKEVNVIWDLAPHDFAILDYFFKLQPKKIFATASKHHEQSITDEMAHITITYTNNFIAHIHVSWLSPLKLRTILIGGTKKMIYFDDIQPDEKIKIYDKGFTILSKEVTPFKPVYRNGNVIIPKVESEEALYQEIKEIVQLLKRPTIDYSNAERNIRIIKLLEKCDRSIKAGRPVNVK